MNKLDFLIIGAQKSGTTTLFKLLSEHPDIYMPEGKEAPFFTKDEEYSKGIEKFMEDFFSESTQGQLLGKATPHYLSDPRAAPRIKDNLPKVKLIAILREPTERALSHFRMSTRKGLEKRNFEQVISDSLVARTLSMARNITVGEAAETSTYVVWGEYGRLLNRYQKLFPKQQFLILFTNDLKDRPDVVMKRILDFLDLPEYSFKSLGKRFHEGGSKERFPFIKHFKKIALIKSLWKSLSPSLRNKILFKINQLNTIKSSDSLANYDSSKINRLKEHYILDINELEDLFNCKVPWR